MMNRTEEARKADGLSLEEKIKTAYFLMIAVFMPLVRLQIVLNATLFDFINVAFILFFLISFFTIRKLQVPLLIPVAFVIIGSLISMLYPQVFLINLLTLITDLYLFIFFIVLYNLIETKQESKILIVCWVIFAALQGGIMLLEFSINISNRGLGSFINPNMASSYLGLSFFLLLHPYFRMRKYLSWILGFFILGGLLATKSLAGLIGLLIGALAAVILYWYHTRAFSRNKLIAAILIIIIIGAAIYPVVARVPILLGRFQRSLYSRINLWKTGLGAFIKNPLGLGIGPGGFKKVGPEIKTPRLKPAQKELHSDWLSFLVERGIFGFMGIVLLFGTIARMLFKLVKMEKSNEELLWIIGLWGMFIFILSFSLTHEILHFRHVWITFALIGLEHKFRMKNLQEKQSNLNQNINKNFQNE